MITINIGVALAGIISAIGLPVTATAFCFWLIEYRIQKRDMQKEKAAEERRKKSEVREKAREQLEVLVLQSNGAGVALAEATAKAVQRIPDAHCNGDMHAALAYAASAKHDLKDFLTKQGVSAIFD